MKNPISDFWDRCAKNDATVCAVNIYSKYRDGNISEEDFLYQRYVCMSTGGSWLVLDKDKEDVFFMVDDIGRDIDAFHETPEQALEWFIANE